MTKKLTVAMATFDDFHGVFFTVQAIRLYQGLDPSEYEIIVLDNNPDSKHGFDTKNFVQGLENGGHQLRYIPFHDSIGTTQTRGRLFQEAQGEIVVVLDCHVLLRPGALRRLLDFYATASEDDKKNLYTGPLLLDGLSWHQTHFECEWRDQMWGVWATAWIAPDGRWFVFKDVGGKTAVKPFNTNEPYQPLDLPWAGHERALAEQGFRPAGVEPTDPPFEIPAQGLGLFVSAKEHWLGFNPDFRSFGGEECYIHEKYRQAGRKTICLPFLGWNHRFGRPDGPKYPITVEGKMRNYILGFQELGLPLDGVYNHFVREQGVRQDVWEYALRDPANYVPGQLYPNDLAAINDADPIMISNLGMPVPVVEKTLAEVSEYLKTKAQRDLDQHADTFRSFASRCESALEFTKRRESTAFLLAGLAEVPCCQRNGCQKTECDRSCQKEARLVSYQEEQDTLLERLDVLAEEAGIAYTNISTNLDSVPTVEGDETFDLLFVDSRHNGERLEEELEAVGHRINKYILLHDTQIYGMAGDNGGRGLLSAAREWCRKHPEWYVAWTTHTQYGFLVLSKVPEERPAEPIRAWPCMTADGQPCGAGSNVKASLKLLGFEAVEGCSCNAKASTMDFMGPDWCEQNLDMIIEWLREEAVSRQKEHLFFRPAVSLMVKRAISKARKDLRTGKCY